MSNINVIIIIALIISITVGGGILAYKLYTDSKATQNTAMSTVRQKMTTSNANSIKKKEIYILDGKAQIPPTNGILYFSWLDEYNKKIVTMIDMKNNTATMTMSNNNKISYKLNYNQYNMLMFHIDNGYNFYISTIDSFLSKYLNIQSAYNFTNNGGWFMFTEENFETRLSQEGEKC